MIETKEQREKRIKGEQVEREKRAAAYAEKMKTQLVPTNATPAAVIPDAPDGPMGPLAAKRITRQIKDNFSACLDLIVEAHDREAWKVLGYKSWGDYTRGEFDFSRSRGYQLLDFARASQTLENVSTLVDKPESERQIRPLMGLPEPQQKKAWKKAVKAAGGQPTARQVRDAVNKAKAVEATVIEPQSLPVDDHGLRRFPQKEIAPIMAEKIETLIEELDTLCGVTDWPRYEIIGFVTDAFVTALKKWSIPADERRLVKDACRCQSKPMDIPEPDPKTAVPCPCLRDGVPCGEMLSPEGLAFLISEGLVPEPIKAQ